MKHRMILCLGMFLAGLSLAVAWAQPEGLGANNGDDNAPQQPAAQGATAATTQPEPATTIYTPEVANRLWRDVGVLRMVARLGLDADQRRRLIAQLSQLNQQQRTARASRAEIWQQKGAAINAVIASWIAGRQPDPESLATATAAATEAASQDEMVESATEAALVMFDAILTEAQRALVETAEEEALRQEAELRYEGQPSLADFVLTHVDAHRELMPDEYALVRVADAESVANKLAEREDPNYGEIVDAVLALFDQVANWTDEEFAAARTELPERIREYLQLTEDVAPKPVRRQAVRRWLQDPRTVQYLALYGVSAQPPQMELDPPQDQLQTALDLARLVSLLNDLRLDLDQLAQLQRIAVDAETAVTNSAANKAALLVTVAPGLAGIIPYMQSGQPLPTEWENYLASIEAQLQVQDDALTRSMVDLVPAFRRMLRPEQQALVDWRVPPTIMAQTSPAERAKWKKEAADMLRDAIALVEFLRPLNLEMFLRVRLIHIEDFLKQYIPEDSSDFPWIRDEIAAIITEVRGIQPEQWEKVAPAVGLRVLHAAGQLQQKEWAPSNLPLDWTRIRETLSAPELAQTVQQMLAARRKM